MLLGLVAAIAVVFGIRLLVTGAPGNAALVITLTGGDWEQLRQAQPGVGRLVSVIARHEGLALLGWSPWLVWSSIRGYRFGEPWIWYAWWSVPAFLLGIRLTGAGAGGALPLVLASISALSVIGLLLSRPAHGAAHDRNGGLEGEAGE